MLTFEPLGRLGNIMWEAAAIVGICNRTDQMCVFPEFDHPFLINFYTDDQLNWKVIDVPWGYHDIKYRDVSLKGYFQSYRYFEHCQDVIRDLFTFKDTGCNFYGGNFISVHVRRGDYTPEYYTTLGRGYYDKALSMLPDLPIVVFTDDVEAAEKVVPSYNVIQSTDDDMALMATAKYAVIANSSYSWWAAYLSNAEKVITPLDWFGPLSPYDTKDMSPPKWIQI